MDAVDLNLTTFLASILPPNAAIRRRHSGLPNSAAECAGVNPLCGGDAIERQKWDQIGWMQVAHVIAYRWDLTNAKPILLSHITPSIYIPA